MKKALPLLRAFFFALGLTACGQTEKVFPGTVKETGDSPLIEMDEDAPLTERHDSVFSRRMLSPLKAPRTLSRANGGPPPSQRNRR